MSSLNNQGSNGQTKQKKSFFRSNPVMNRLNKIDDVRTDGKAAGYGRITLKTAFFLLMTVGGMMLYLVLNSTLFAGQPQVISFTYAKSFHVTASAMQIGFAVGASILAVIMQLVAAFAPGSIPVTGTIYSACQGFLISFIVFTLIKGYEYLGLLALAITVVVVFCMAMLYAKGVIRVSKKFFMVLITLVAAMFGIAILSLIGYLIPLTRPFVSAIMGNFWISLLLTVFSIIIACLFLISDFATIENVVENNMPAKYEWMAAFGLAFTVLWIYVKILDLLIQILGNSKSSS